MQTLAIRAPAPRWGGWAYRMSFALPLGCFAGPPGARLGGDAGLKGCADKRH